MRFVLSLFAGLAAMLIAAIAWAALTAAISYQIGYMAIGVGFAVAFAIRFFAHSEARIYAYLSAALSLLGCALGNYLAAIVVAAHSLHANIADLAIDNLDRFFAVLAAGFQPMDALFYGLGIYFGYKYALAPRRRAPAVPPPAPDAAMTSSTD